jgi:predicted small integral membrane protein
MGIWQRQSPGGSPRRGILGLTTTRGDRLFISLLAAAYLHMLWLALSEWPLPWATALSCVLAVFIFRKV